MKVEVTTLSMLRFRSALPILAAEVLLVEQGAPSDTDLSNTAAKNGWRSKGRNIHD